MSFLHLFPGSLKIEQICLLQYRGRNLQYFLKYGKIFSKILKFRKLNHLFLVFHNHIAEKLNWHLFKYQKDPFFN